jgi:hypothetical protein
MTVQHKRGPAKYFEAVLNMKRSIAIHQSCAYMLMYVAYSDGHGPFEYACTISGRDCPTKSLWG